jgi:hypothetical protein
LLHPYLSLCLSVVCFFLWLYFLVCFLLLSCISLLTSFFICFLPPFFLSLCSFPVPFFTSFLSSFLFLYLLKFFRLYLHLVSFYTYSSLLPWLFVSSFFSSSQFLFSCGNCPDVLLSAPLYTNFLHCCISISLVPGFMVIDQEFV